jgi:hypothetical protein
MWCVQEGSLELEMVELGTKMEKLREERREEGRLRQLLEEQVQLVQLNTWTVYTREGQVKRPTLLLPPPPFNSKNLSRAAGMVEQLMPWTFV